MDPPGYCVALGLLGRRRVYTIRLYQQRLVAGLVQRQAGINFITTLYYSSYGHIMQRLTV